MLRYRECASPLLGGYLAIMVAGSSLADALPSFLLDARLSSLGGCFVTLALSKLYATITYPIHTGSIGRFWC